ncbi:TIR domain-containing protein [Streptomyces sp. A5-4]|uniref:TIR domain-containing protein n=1 Tax=Streptomyces sp. A5-4 TaxID=3384771 RepID=UPI003DA8010C
MTKATKDDIGRRRRLWWLFNCIIAWALCYPFVGPWAALAGLVVPAAAFVRCIPLRMYRLPRGVATSEQRVLWSWRALADPERILFMVCAGSLCTGALWLAQPMVPTSVYWIAQFIIAQQLLLWVGALTVVPAGRLWDPAQDAVTPARRPELFIVLCALAGATVYGTAAWCARQWALPIGRRTGSLRPELHRLEEGVRWLDQQIADSLFAVSLPHAYWPLLAAGAGLIAGGAAAAAREHALRAASAGRLFEELAEAQEEGPTAVRIGKVFVSYSRRDSAFAEQLRGRLATRVREVWVDWLSIEPSTQWRESIDDAIQGSDAVVVLLSRDALRSKYCWSECERAIELGKRILPVVIDAELEQGASAALRAEGWDALTGYHFLRMSRPDQFDSGVERIHSFVESRYRWTAFHTRIGVRAHEWHSSGRSGGLLLRGHELVVAQAWRRRAPAADEQYHAAMTDIQTDFLEASRAAARRRGARLRIGATATSLALAALASLVVAGEEATMAQRREADSRRLAAAANERAAGDVRQAALLSAAAFHQSDSAEARESMFRQLTRFNETRGVIPARKSPISDMVLSQDEKVLVMWRTDETVEVWDTTAMRSRGTVPGKRMSSAAGGDLSANGRTLGILRKGIAVLIDTRTMKELHRADLRPFGTTGVFSTADLSRDGKTLMLNPAPVHDAENFVHLWDVASGKVTREVPGDDLVGGAYGRAVQTMGGDDAPSTIRDMADPKRMTTLPRGVKLVGMAESGAPVVIQSGTVKVLAAARKPPWTVGSGLRSEVMTPDGRFLAVARTAEPGQYDMWDLRARKRIGRVNSPEYVGEYGPRLILSDDGSRLALGGTSFDIYQETSQYTVYNTRTGRKEADLPGHVTALGPHGRLMAGATSSGTVTLWDRGPARSLLSRYKTPVPVAPRIAVAAHAGTAAVLGTDGTARLLRRSDGRLMQTMRLSAPAAEPALSPDGTLLAVAEASGQMYERQAYVEVFDTASGRRVKRLTGGGIGSPRILPTALQFSPDGTRLYLGEQNGVSVYEWHTDTWRPGHRFGPDFATGYVSYTAVSPDGSMLAVGGGQKKVQLWDTATGKRFGKAIPGAVAVGFRPDGLLVTGGVGRGDPALRLWEPRGQRLLSSGPDAGERTLGLAVSPDGQTVASVTGDRRVLLWGPDLERNIPIKNVQVPDGGAMAFTGQGDKLVITQPGEFLSLLVGPRRWLSALCRIAGGPMTAAQWQTAAPGERYQRIC